jgi:hypothetical protein
MKPTYVLASADSRLHADIMMIRLRRAGIDIDRISAVFSDRFAPNSFFFWLRSPRTLRCPAKGETYFVAGPLEQSFGGANEVEAVPTILKRLGLTRNEAAHFARSLWLGRGVLCVQAKNQDEAAVAWHIFKHSRAEDIAVSSHSSADRTESVYGPVSPAWAAVVAA